MPEGKGNTKLARVCEGGVSIKVGKPHVKWECDPLRDVWKPGVYLLQSPSRNQCKIAARNRYVCIRPIHRKRWRPRQLRVNETVELT